MDKTPTPHIRRLALLVWVLLALFYFYLSYDYIRATMNDRAFGEYLDYVVRIAGTERRPAKEIRQLLLIKADELALPIRGDGITVHGLGDGLAVRVDYNVDIEIPLFERAVYTKQFMHEGKYERAR